MSLKRSTQVGGFVPDPPFNRARAKVDKVSVENRTGQFAKPEDVDIVLSLVDVQVLETDTAFPYKVAELRMRDSSAVNSRKGILEASIDACLGQDASSEESPLLKIEGKTIVLEKEEKYLFFTRKSGEESRGTVWRVTNVEGKTASSPVQEALDLLDGKSRGDFVMAALTSPNISRDSALQSSLIDETFFNRDEVVNGFTVDNGIYKKN